MSKRFSAFRQTTIIIGISEPVHTEEQLKEFADNSKKKYDLTQQQRAMETKLRSLKTRRLAASAAGDELEAKRLSIKSTSNKPFTADSLKSTVYCTILRGRVLRGIGE